MNLQETILLEKYKYILSRKQALNEATFKIAAIYQALILGLAVAQYNILSEYQNKKISAELSFFSSACLMVIFMAITFLILCLLIGGVYAWLKYRKDESEIEFKTLGTLRASITFKNIFAWYETYLALIVLLIGCLGLFAYKTILFP
jgi:hypothetical protein